MSTARASPIGLPLSSTSIVASSSLCSSIRSASAQSSRARCVGGVARQPRNASAAAWTAGSTSGSRGQRDLGEGFAGRRVDRRQPVIGADVLAADVQPQRAVDEGGSRGYGGGGHRAPFSSAIEDLAAEHAAAAQGGQGVGDAVERVAAGERHDQAAPGRHARCASFRSVLVAATVDTRLVSDRMNSMGWMVQRLVGVPGADEPAAGGQRADTRGHRVGGADQLEEHVGAAAAGPRPDRVGQRRVVVAAAQHDRVGGPVLGRELRLVRRSRRPR